jgi:hypothetical protein
MGFDVCQQSNFGFYAADVDMSVAATWRYAWVWLGPALHIAGHGQGGGAVQAIGALTSPPLGIAQNPANQGEAVEVCRDGGSKAIAGGTFAVGDLLMAASNGSTVKCTTGNMAIARALESAVIGDITSVEVKCFGKQ